MGMLATFLRVLTGRDAGREPSRGDIERAASTQIVTVDTIVARPQLVDVFDKRFREIAATNAVLLELRLSEGLSSRPIGEQVAACRVLAKVAPAAALARLMDIVAMTELDPEIARAAIWEMSRAIFEVNETNLAFDRQRALDVLRPQLTMGQTHQRKNVVDMLALVDLPEARDLLRGLLADPDIDLRLRVAERLASIRDAAGWPVLKEVLTNRSPAHDRQRHWAILALKDIIDLPDSCLREEVLALAASEVERLLERSDNGAANEVMNLLRVVEAAPPAWAAELLGRVAGSQMETWVRDLAFQKQLELGGFAAVPAISKALQDNHYLFATLNTLLKAGPSAAAPEIVRGVSQVLDECNAGHQADLAYRALLAIGSGAQDVIERNRGKLTPWFAFSASIRARGLGAEAVLGLLRRIELMDADRIAAIGEETCLTILGRRPNDPDPTGGVLELLHKARALHVFDTENDRVPPDYVSLFDAIAHLAMPRFLIDHVSQRANGHEVMFLFDGEPSRFIARDMGDWFDVSGLLSHLNDLIAAKGRPERFAALHSGDQMSYVVVGHGQRMIEVKRELDFPLADDPDSAMRIGQAYEQHVIAQIGTCPDRRT